jgi:dihydroorotate dehydrogenase
MLYKRLIRPLLFKLEPETVHRNVTGMLKMTMAVPGVRQLMESSYCVRDKSLERTVFGLNFRNPVGLAAGFDKNAELYNELKAFGFSFVEIGTVTPLAQPGNPKPRSFRLPKDRALINRMGINNPGAHKVAENLRARRPEIIIGGNIGKNTVTPNDRAVDDYVECFKVLHDVVDYFVVNVSCPNIGDIKKLQDTENMTLILDALKNLSAGLSRPRPVLLKISPDLNDRQLEDVVKIALKTGTDGFVATNTTITRNNLSTGKDAVKRIGEGGLSGSPLRDRSTFVIKFLADRLGGKIPVIGAGGILTPEDAVSKLEAGASLIQVYTGFIYEGPAIARRINRAILEHQGSSS